MKYETRIKYFTSFTMVCIHLFQSLHRIKTLFELFGITEYLRISISDHGVILFVKTTTLDYISIHPQYTYYLKIKNFQ